MFVTMSYVKNGQSDRLSHDLLGGGNTIIQLC